MSNRQKVVTSNWNLPSEDGNYYIITQTGLETESNQDQTSLDQNTSPTETSQQSRLQIQNPSHSELFFDETQKPPWELEQGPSDDFSLDRGQAEDDSLKRQHQ